MVPFACMPSLIPRQVAWNFVRSYHSIRFGLPRNRGGSAPALVFSRPAPRLLTLRPARSPSRLATFYTEGFSSFVASAAASIATGWSEPVPGRVTPAVDHHLFTAHPVMRLTGNWLALMQVRRVQQSATPSVAAARGEASTPLFAAIDADLASAKLADQEGRSEHR
jgi:hypothetical protein